MTRYGLLILPALLASCGSAEPEPNTTRSVVITGNDNELVVPRPRADNVTNAAEAVGAAVTLGPDGLGLAPGGGAMRRASFGMPRALVTRMLAAALGDPIEEGDDQECGAGALGFTSFRDGLGLYFQQGKFVGWDLDGGEGDNLATATGVGIGTTRKQLESTNAVTVEDSTLGIEFSAGGMSGLLSARDPDGQITNLWAGSTCIAR